MTGDLWQLGCERLAAELPEQQFNTWIRPLPSGSVTDQGEDGAVVTLRVPNRFKLDWIRNQYAGRIEAVLSEIAGKPVRLEIALAPREGNAAPVGISPGSGHGGPVSAIRALAGLKPGGPNDQPGGHGRVDGQGNASAGPMARSYAM
ncbi:MAG: DnaA N-terminal domain-containing protein, partial [Burkholderiaceae bacterium]